VILVIDNFDSFTYNLVAYFKELGQEVEVITNEKVPSELKLEKYMGVVLSPGPSLPKDSNNLKDLIKFIQGRLPLLGICLGHQALAEVNGARLVRMARPEHGKVFGVNCSGDVLFEGVPSCINVVRYHSWLVEGLPKGFLVVAKTSKNEVMAYENEVLKIDGIQFHPESILTEFGIEILRNWLVNRVGVSRNLCSIVS
jgi:para-aminobenzoate synthetase component 2